MSEPAKSGWRTVFLEKGAKEFAKSVRANPGVLIMDTTWRDAHQSLLATRVRSIDLANIATTTSHAFQKAFALEVLMHIRRDSNLHPDVGRRDF